MRVWHFIKKRKWKIFFLLPFLFLSWEAFIYLSTLNKTFSASTYPENHHIGVVLGTSKYIRGGRKNLFYKYRIASAAELYRNQTIQKILVSGDNQTKSYNEPKQMREDLVSLGIPEEDITLDYAGFRTLDSMVRAKEVFGQEKFLVISQCFHVRRALFISFFKGIDAQGYCTKKVSLKYGFKTFARERLARIKMGLDLIFQKQPRHLGEPVSI